MLVAIVCAVYSISSVSLLPPKLKAKSFETAGATAAVLVDLHHSVLVDSRPAPDWGFFVRSMIARAALLARVTTTEPVVRYIGREAGVAPDRIAAVTPVTASVPSELTDPGSEQRAHELLLDGDRYRLEVEPRGDVPIIDIYSQAPSPAEAQGLATAAIAGLRDYLHGLYVTHRVDPASQLVLTQLGPARAGVLNSGAKLRIAVLAFAFAFSLCCVLLRALVRWRAPRPSHGRAFEPRTSPAVPSARKMIVAGVVRRGSSGAGHRLAAVSPRVGVAHLRRLGPPVRMVTRGGDWPRTTRVLPWLLALFIAMLWLIPFDSITLGVSSPIDLKLDRLLLPAVAGAWLLSLAMGGRNAPRIRVTKVHIAVGVYVSLAFLSVLVNATSLSQSLELDTSFKKLPLLISYLSLFVMVSSVIRLREVRPFLTYTLALAVVCAIGVIVEYKTQYNVFFELPSQLLPSVFKVKLISSYYGGDGRLNAHGPTMHGLAVSSMLAMALPIALMRMIRAPRARTRLLYALVAGVLVVGMLATQKKTALLAALAAVLVLCWFRRREMLKLAPLALLGLIVILIVSPGTIDPVINQFTPTQLGSGAPATTSDRASRWDAIRPDVWTHLVLGRGFGSYQPLGHRILDSQLLGGLVETGVLGLLAFFALGVSVVVMARATINSRDPTRAPPALVGAASAAVFVVVAVLFDSLAPAQVPYVFLYFAALVVVAVAAPQESVQPSLARTRMELAHAVSPVRVLRPEPVLARPGAP